MRQYTVRNISSALDQALREWARQRNISLNKAIVDAIKRGIGMDGDQEHNDLDDFIGTWQQDTIEQDL